MLNITNKSHQQNLSWEDPLQFAEKIAGNYGDANWVFLYSGLSDTVPHSFSYIALFPKQEMMTDDFSDVEQLINDDEAWFGYLSYELGGQFEKLPDTRQSHIHAPKVWLANFALILQFDHDKAVLKAFFDDQADCDKLLQYQLQVPMHQDVTIDTIESNFTDDSYKEAIADIKKMIAQGDFYQTNLTRKFFGQLHMEDKAAASYFALFQKLCLLSPANYSAFLACNQHYVISASPELFLTVDGDREIKSRPIKGTTPRSKDEQIDLKNKLELHNSPKERAENLMIVDLVRNDLSRVSVPGSVKVKKLFEITSYQNIHHLSSLVTGLMSPDYAVLDVVKACFPAGSMTGAPKIKAMEVAAIKEGLDRGIYSGAIGFIGAGQLNLSVVIRTLLCKGDDFEFQVGGAITFDSDETKELEEIFSKGRSIFNLLGQQV